MDQYTIAQLTILGAALVLALPVIISDPSKTAKTAAARSPWQAPELTIWSVLRRAETLPSTIALEIIARWL